MATEVEIDRYTHLIMQELVENMQKETIMSLNNIPDGQIQCNTSVQFNTQIQKAETPSTFPSAPEKSSVGGSLTTPAFSERTVNFVPAPAPIYNATQVAALEFAGAWEIDQESKAGVIRIKICSEIRSASTDLYRNSGKLKKYKEKYVEIAFGNIFASGIKTVIMVNGNKSETLIVKVQPADPRITDQVEVEIDKTNLFNNPSLEIKKILDAGISPNYMVPAVEKKLAAVVLKLFAETVPITKVHRLPYLSDSGTIVIPDCSGEGMSDDAFSTLLIAPGTLDTLGALSLSIAAQILHLLDFQDVKPVIATGLTQEQKMTLAELCGMEKPVKLTKDTLRMADDVPLVIDIDSASREIQQRSVREAAASDRMCGIIFITSDITVSLPNLTEWNYTQISLRGFSIASPHLARNKIGELLSRSAITSYIKGAWQFIEAADFDTGERKFASIMIGAALFLLCSTIPDKVQVAEIIENFVKAVDRKLTGFTVDAGEFVRKAAVSGTYPLFHSDRLLESDLEGFCFSYNDNELRISAKMMTELSRAAGFCSRLQFVKALDSEKLLDYGRVTGKQRACRFGYGSTSGIANFYVVPLDRLFSFGEIGLNANEFDIGKPEIHISLAKCGDTEIFFSLERADGSENGHIYICGKTRSGKTTLGIHFALECMKANIPVVSFGLHTPGSDDTAVNLPGVRKIYVGSEEQQQTWQFRVSSVVMKGKFADEFTAEEQYLLTKFENDSSLFLQFDELLAYISHGLDDIPEHTVLLDKLRYLYDKGIFTEKFEWAKFVRPGEGVVVVSEDDETLVNSLLRQFYMFQRNQRHIQPCLFMCDECDRLNISQSGVLVDDYIRRGAKYGIMLVILSQYLNSQNAANLTNTLKEFGTIIAFDPIADALRYMGISINDPGVRAAIRGIGKHSFLAVGSLATDNCFLTKPVIARLELNDEQRLK